MQCVLFRFAQKGSLGIRLDQRSGFQRIRRMSFEVGLEPRRPHTKRPERPALAKRDHHPGRLRFRET